MKRIKFVAVAALVFILCAVTAFGINAKWWDENPFTDVKSTHWYYDAVRICNENELVAGMSETKFAPNVKMTRAMIVTMLAKDAGFEGGYTSTPFSDVKSNHWFAPYVQWAFDNDITSGVSDTAFAPNREITREQLAAMLYRYAAFKGISTDNSTDISGFVDVSKVSPWAKESIEWANGCSIISGSKKGEELYLNPKNSASRAECAQMLSKFLYLAPVYEINGNDLSLYKIVYCETEMKSVKESALALSEYIEQSVGISLPVVNDTEAVSDFEILVGKTNREDKGIVTVDRKAFSDDQQFICCVQGNYLLLSGIDTEADMDTGDRNTYNIDGSQNAVYYFLEEEFGLEFYYEGRGVIATPDPIISFDDGYLYTDAPEFETRCLYIHDIGGDMYLGCGYYYSDWGCGLPHQLGNLMTGAWRDTYENTWDTPCLSKPENIESLIKNVGELLEEKPDKNLIGLIQNDSSYYCRCDLCAVAYREEGTRGGALLRLVNLVAETFEEEYPTVRFATWAYNWSIKPPTSDFKFHKNVILHYNTLHLCPAHEYSDTGCEHNDESAVHIKKWGEICNTIYLWEHSGNFTDALTPFPDFDSILPNARYFAENKAEGVFLNSMSDRVADFCELRGYLFARVYRDPYMTEEEYNYRMNGFLKAYYGDGWKYIREYIDTITELANKKCHSFHAGTQAYYDYNDIISVMDRLDLCWQKAKEEAGDPQLLENITVTELSWTYLKQCALFKPQFENGDEQQRLAYENESAMLRDALEKYEICVTESPDGSYDFNLSDSPEFWGK